MNNIHSLYTNAMGVRAVFSQNLKDLRKSTGLSAKAFGKGVGVSGKHIYDMEDGIRGPSLELLERISEVHGVAKSSLLEVGMMTSIAPTRPEPVSIFAKKLMSIPDDVYELAQRLGDPNDHDTWEGVRGVLEAGIEMAEASRQEKKG